MKKLIVIALTMMLFACFTNDAEAIKALDDNGFTDITITERGTMGAQWEGCGQDDQAYYRATAVNPAGKRVRMLVCCGGGFSYKGCVIRSK